MNPHMNPYTRRHPRTPAAFTLTELIVVLTVIVIMVAVAIPAFRSIIAGTESSNAETQLRLAFLTGRDTALHSDSQADSAVVFFYEPGGRTTALACTHVGTFTDRSPPNAPPFPKRDVFVPVSTFEPIQLPRGWMVRGFVPAGSLEDDRQWYDDLGNGRPIDPDERNWVFPETEFYDALVRDDGGDRQSFMVRFSGLTGAMVVGDSREALVLAPRATAAARGGRPFDDYRFDRGADLAALARRALHNDLFQGGIMSNPDDLSKLLGDMSGDTVLCRAVEQIALYKEAELAAALQVRLEPETGTIYKVAKAPEYVTGLNADDVENMRRWLEGDSNLTGGDTDWLDENDLPAARLYTLQRYTGVLQPVPLLDLEELINGTIGGAP
jgi:prepilin-type N-terminal cleavage/methylation domain-containing protein